MPPTVVARPALRPPRRRAVRRPPQAEAGMDRLHDDSVLGALTKRIELVLIWKATKNSSASHSLSQATNETMRGPGTHRIGLRYKTGCQQGTPQGAALRLRAAEMPAACPSLRCARGPMLLAATARGCQGSVPWGGEPLGCDAYKGPVCGPIGGRTSGRNAEPTRIPETQSPGRARAMKRGLPRRRQPSGHAEPKRAGSPMRVTADASSRLRGQRAPAA